MKFKPSGLRRRQKRTLVKVLVLALELLAIGLVIYLVAAPFYPGLKYKIAYENRARLPDAADEAAVKEYVSEIMGSLPAAEYAVSPNRLIIPKIGLNAPIVEGKSAEYNLSRGAWRLPDSSSPNKGGNTVITGHRFKYLPPNNVTFYLFHKLATDDLVSVIWNEQDYLYRIKEVKIVENTDFSILEQSTEPILTLFTCHPIYSTDQRLVVIAELIED